MKRLVLAIMIAAVALAQPLPQPPPPDNDSAGDTGDAPDRGVARISFINGNVSVRRGDSGELVDAVLNAPLTATDRVVTAEGSRAEVQFDSANLVRLGPATEVRLGELRYGQFQIQVAVGSTTFRVLRESNAQVEISTPSVSVRPTRTGVYRVTVQPDGTSEITVRSGDAEIFSPRGTEQLHTGRTMAARGSASDPEFQLIAEIPQDDLDRWSASRDQQFERAASPRYVSPDVSGAEDLDSYGRWSNDPQYGNVWVPTVDPGWAPYRCGRWTWIDYYGWTWVGCEPWGWAPYHYGNWYWGSLGWAWYPGPIHSRYYWRPALVGFFGWGGGGVDVGFGFGNVGWVPLAPFERFHPWYGRGGFRGPTVVNNVNIVNVTNVYRNARFNNGITSVRAGDFGRGGVGNNNFIRASSGDLARAGMVRGALPVAPSRESVRFSNREAVTRGLPRTNDNQHFFSQSQVRQGTLSPGGAPPSSGQFGGNSNGGWRRFDPSTRGSVQGGGSVAGQGNGGGRQPFSQGNAGGVNHSGNSPSFSQGNRGFQRLDGGARNDSRGPQVVDPPSRNLSPGNDGGGNRPSFEGNRGFQRLDSGARNESSRPQAVEPPSRSFSPPVANPGTEGNHGLQRLDSGPRGDSSRTLGSQQPVRINPPIVENRGNSGGGGGGGNRGPGGGGNQHGGGGGGHDGSHGGGGERGGGERGGGRR